MTDIQTTTTSKQFSLNVKDVLKGLLVSVIGAVLTAIQTSISAGSLVFDWKSIGIVALTTGVAYLLKNFFTPSQTIINPAPTVPTVIPPQAPGTTTIQSKP